MLRIGIDARYVNNHFPGIGRATYELVRALGTLEPPRRFIILYNPAGQSRLDLTGLQHTGNLDLVACPARPLSLAEQWQVPRQLRRMRLDLFHAPYYIKPITSPGCPVIVTIYDLIGRRDPGQLSLRGRLLFDLAMRLALRSTAYVITCSRSTATDLERFYGWPASRMSIVPLGVGAHFAPAAPETIAALRARLNLPERYVLYVGSNKPHKNLERLVLAWERVPAARAGTAVLVLAGHMDPRYPQTRRLVEQRGLAATVRFVPGVAEADLPALYSGAELFCFPSLYEGFGLPVLEAMACGTPIVCSNRDSLPEVAGDAAVQVDPTDHARMASMIDWLLNDPWACERLRVAGRARAQAFTWGHAAQATIDVYATTVSQHRARFS